MSERIKCPSCGTGLILPQSIRGSRATCPRCLAEISTITTSAAGREADAIQMERPEPREERLRLEERGRDAAPDVDVRLDTKGTSCLVIALAVIGGVGLCWYSWMLIPPTNGSYIPYRYYLFWAVGLLFLAGISTLIVFVRSGGNPGASGFRRVAVGTLALGGLVILVILAIGICYFVVCMATGGGRFDH